MPRNVVGSYGPKSELEILTEMRYLLRPGHWSKGRLHSHVDNSYCAVGALYQIDHGNPGPIPYHGPRRFSFETRAARRVYKKLNKYAGAQISIWLRIVSCLLSPFGITNIIIYNDYWSTKHEDVMRLLDTTERSFRKKLRNV